MNNLLDNSLNLKLVNLVCSGVGVEVNVSELSKLFQKHRNTIANKINKLIEYKIIDKPLCSFHWIFNEYPLLVIEKSVFSRDLKTETFIEKDPHIMKAFLFKEDEYNTLLIELHRDLYEYQIWKDMIEEKEKISLNESSYPSNSILLSTKNFLKYDPSASIQIIEQHYNNGRQKSINGLSIDGLSLEILKALLTGKGLKINENLLARELKVHRRTIQRRLRRLISEQIISKPICRFPRIWIPAEYFQVLSLVKIKKKKELVIKTLKEDPRVPVLVKANERHFNLVVFSNFHNMEDHLAWQEDYDQRFPGCIGEIKNSYLSPAMTFAIRQEHVSLNFIQRRLYSLQSLQNGKN